MLTINAVSIIINILIFFIIIVNYKRINCVLSNKLLIVILAIILVIIDIVVRAILGSENIWAVITRSIIYPVNISIFVYLILNRKI